jgi:hypothetical protein
MGFWGFMIMLLLRIFRRYEGTEVKPLQKVPNSEILVISGEVTRFGL